MHSTERGCDWIKSKRGEGNGGGGEGDWETWLLGSGLTRLARFGSEELGTKIIGCLSGMSSSGSEASGEEKRTFRPSEFVRGPEREESVTAAPLALASPLWLGASRS